MTEEAGTGRLSPAIEVRNLSKRFGEVLFCLGLFLASLRNIRRKWIL